MLDRVLIAAGLLALFALALWLGRRWYAARNARIEARVRKSSPAQAEADAPRIVYFTTQSCVVCKTQQEPALDALQERMSDLVIERFDAVVEGELAKTYGVLSVPTTAVYDRTGTLVTINRGFTPAAVLRAQIDGTDPEFESGSVMASEQVA
jgi:thiol-disulfide isomerase/thioredoxin